MKSIFDFVAGARDDYVSDTVEITEGYEFSQHQTLCTIQLYDNSRFTSGNTDNLGREKPFSTGCDSAEPNNGCHFKRDGCDGA